MPTTHIKTEPGLGILADNQDILANSIDYYADGSAVMNDTVGGHVLLCSNTTVLCRDLEQLCIDTLILIHDKVELGIRCNNRVVLCNDRDTDCQGATLFNDVGYS